MRRSDRTTEGPPKAGAAPILSLRPGKLLGGPSHGGSTGDEQDQTVNPPPEKHDQGQVEGSRQAERSAENENSQRVYRQQQ